MARDPMTIEVEIKKVQDTTGSGCGPLSRRMTTPMKSVSRSTESAIAGEMEQP